MFKCSPCRAKASRCPRWAASWPRGIPYTLHPASEKSNQIKSSIQAKLRANFMIFRCITYPLWIDTNMSRRWFFSLHLLCISEIWTDSLKINRASKQGSNLARAPATFAAANLLFLQWQLQNLLHYPPPQSPYSFVFGFSRIFLDYCSFLHCVYDTMTFWLGIDNYLKVYCLFKWQIQMFIDTVSWLASFRTSRYLRNPDSLVPFIRGSVPSYYSIVQRFHGDDTSSQCNNTGLFLAP